MNFELQRKCEHPKAIVNSTTEETQRVGERERAYTVEHCYCRACGMLFGRETNWRWA